MRLELSLWAAIMAWQCGMCLGSGFGGADTVRGVAQACLFKPGHKDIDKIIQRLRRNLIPAEAVEVSVAAVDEEAS